MAWHNTPKAPTDFHDRGHSLFGQSDSVMALVDWGGKRRTAREMWKSTLRPFLKHFDDVDIRVVKGGTVNEVCDGIFAVVMDPKNLAETPGLEIDETNAETKLASFKRRCRAFPHMIVLRIFNIHKM